MAIPQWPCLTVIEVISNKQYVTLVSVTSLPLQAKSLGTWPSLSRNATNTTSGGQGRKQPNKTKQAPCTPLQLVRALFTRTQVSLEGEAEQKTQGQTNNKTNRTTEGRKEAAIGPRPNTAVTSFMTMAQCQKQRQLVGSKRLAHKL